MPCFAAEKAIVRIAAGPSGRLFVVDPIPVSAGFAGEITATIRLLRSFRGNPI